MLNQSILPYRAKLLTLWIAVMFCYLYGDYFKFYIPGETESLIKGDTLLNSPWKILSASILMLLPPLAMVVTAFAQAKIARSLNISLGIFFTGIMLLIGFTTLDLDYMAYAFYAFVESALTIAIVSMAWNWPKQKATHGN